MATTDAVDLLRSIDISLSAILLVLKAQRANAKSAPDGRPEMRSASALSVASDLDSQYGNPEVRAKDPRDWTGEPMKGRKFSECPAEYLDLLAARFDYFAGKEEDPKKANYNRKDAARARGWAARLRAGYVNTATGEIADPEDGHGNGPVVFEDSEWPTEDEAF